MTRSNDTTPSRARWSDLARAELGKEVRPHTTSGGIVYAPVYFPGEVTPDPTTPGDVPFTRGVYASMYHGRPWTLRQYAGFSTAEDSNSFFRSCLAAGQRGLSVAFDLPTHRGYDSDHERATADVGKAGVAIDSVEDMLALFDGIDLSEVSVSMTMNGAVLPVMAAFIVAAEERGVAQEKLSGTIQNDILKEFLVRNTYIYPPRESLRITTDVIGYAKDHLPRFNPVSVSGYHFKEAGASEELELAFTVGDALEYVRCAVDGGMNVDDFAPRISFFFGIGMDLFLEVAKLRAARRLWADCLRERFGAKRPESLRMRIHCQTSGVSLTAQQPLNNVVRTTIEALAAILGGTQSLHTNAYDEALALPTDASAAVARSTQLILQEETDITRSVDPLAGSYLVEDLTNQLYAAARKILVEIDSVGGMARAIETGQAQARIVRASALWQGAVDSGTIRRVGVNSHRAASESVPEVRVIGHEHVLRTQTARLKMLRQSRDQGAVDVALSALRTAATASENLLERAIHCMKARATLGEVSQVLEDVFGRHEPRAVGVAGAYGQVLDPLPEWSTLRERIEMFHAREGRRPRILVAKLGQDGHDRGAKVVASGFADAGFDVDLGPLFQTPAEVARAAVESDVHVVGVSSHAAGHRILVPDLIAELAKVAPQAVVVCGGIIPEQDRPLLKKAGVAAVFDPGTRLVDAASVVLDAIEERLKVSGGAPLGDALSRSGPSGARP